VLKSNGMFLCKRVDNPNNTFIQLRKKKVGANKYNRTIKNKVNAGNRSKKKLKNKNSAIKKIEPGNPKKIKQFIKATRNNLGHKKFTPLISVMSLVLNRLFIASTSKNEFVDNKA